MVGVEHEIAAGVLDLIAGHRLAWNAWLRDEPLLGIRRERHSPQMRLLRIALHLLRSETASLHELIQRIGQEVQRVVPQAGVPRAEPILHVVPTFHFGRLGDRREHPGTLGTRTQQMEPVALVAPPRFPSVCAFPGLFLDHQTQVLRALYSINTFSPWTPGPSKLRPSSWIPHTGAVRYLAQAASASAGIWSGCAAACPLASPRSKNPTTASHTIGHRPGKQPLTQAMGLRRALPPGNPSDSGAIRPRLCTRSFRMVCKCRPGSCCSRCSPRSRSRVAFCNWLSHTRRDTTRLRYPRSNRSAEPALPLTTTRFLRPSAF